MAFRTWESLDRHAFQFGLSWSALKILVVPWAGLITPQRITPKSALRLVVSRSKQQQLIWFIENPFSPGGYSLGKSNSKANGLISGNVGGFLLSKALMKAAAASGVFASSILLLG